MLHQRVIDRGEGEGEGEEKGEEERGIESEKIFIESYKNLNIYEAWLVSEVVTRKEGEQY